MYTDRYETGDSPDGKIDAPDNAVDLLGPQDLGYLDGGVVEQKLRENLPSFKLDRPSVLQETKERNVRLGSAV